MSTEQIANLPAASLTDIYSAATAVTFAIIGSWLRWRSRDAQHAKRWGAISLIANDLLKGASFFPFILLSISIFDAKYLRLLVETNRLVLFLSGVIAALYVVGEFIRSAQGALDHGRVGE